MTRAFGLAAQLASESSCARTSRFTGNTHPRQCDINGIVRNRACPDKSLNIMYINLASMHIHDILATKGSDPMTTASKRSHKHFQLDSAKIKRAQRALHAKTEN